MRRSSVADTDADVFIEISFTANAEMNKNVQRISFVADLKLLKQNVFTVDKYRKRQRNYLYKMCLPRINSVVDAEIKPNIFTTDNFYNGRRNN